jgi:hypothetical protein
VNQTGDDDIAIRDKAKIAIYGFKPLEISYRGYNRQGNEKGKEIDPLKQAFKALNKKAQFWYSRLDEMYSGTITVITDFIEPETNPRAGFRAGFLGGEFYITKTEHRWQYGGTPTITLTLTRGMHYKNGDYAGPLEDIGTMYKELDEFQVVQR